MSVLDQIAYLQGRRDEEPNEILARTLAMTEDRAGIREIAKNLWHTNTHIQTDCVKVLYELGAVRPDLIAEYTTDFLKLLTHKHNQLVWGGMTALSMIAAIRADTLFEQWPTIWRVTQQGSVITQDHGVYVLAVIASTGDDRRAAILPPLLTHLATCRPKDVPQRAEKIAVAVDATTKDEFIKTLEARLDNLSATQAARVKRVIKAAEKR